MSLLNQVKKGKLKQPVLALVYGVDGIGKSTLGAGAPNPIFLGTEKGTANLDVARYPTPNSFKEVMAAIADLTKSKHDFKTLVIDSLDWLEPLVWEHACIENDWKNIEAAGYGKGYVVANKYWLEMISAVGKLREATGMNIILIAHSQVKLAKDPSTQTEYDRYQLKLNEKSAALWREFVDMVLFYNFQTYTKTVNGKTKAFGEGDRILYTERRPGFDAKNRFGLEFEIPVFKEDPWACLMSAMESANPNNIEAVKRAIAEMMGRMAEGALKEKVSAAVTAAANNFEELARIASKLEKTTQ
jgi:hypothetical protein